MSNEYDKNLDIIQNKLYKLNKGEVDKSSLIGFLAIIIFEKTIFKKNKDIKVFIEQIFGITYLDYVIASRTMIFSRISKYTYNMDENEIKSKIDNLVKYFNISDEKSKPKKKKNENDKLDIWLKRL